MNDDMEVQDERTVLWERRRPLVFAVVVLLAGWFASGGRGAVRRWLLACGAGCCRRLAPR